MQPDTEHEQDHADLGELLRQPDIGDEAGRGGADDDARDQVTDQRRHLQACGDEAHDEGKPQAGGNRGDQSDVMGQSASSSGLGTRRTACARTSSMRTITFVTSRRQEREPKTNKILPQPIADRSSQARQTIARRRFPDQGVSIVRLRTRDARRVRRRDAVRAATTASVARYLMAVDALPIAFQRPSPRPRTAIRTHDKTSGCAPTNPAGIRGPPQARVRHSRGSERLRCFHGDRRGREIHSHRRRRTLRRLSPALLL